MKVTSLRYLDAKFHHPSPKIKKKSQKYQRTVGYPSTSWASCFENVSSESQSDEMLNQVANPIVAIYRNIL